ncbi:MAG TPA: SDR family NAD(P)-dependent oxidoreductase [Frankiaceae bacterium]|nr:SDR family NAD(P)-dependent oxidoreductase [Frankiaceae bacterium]
MTSRTAVVTGASGGIGAATARALSALGFDVVLGARRLDRLAAVAGGCPGPGAARALPLDVTSTGSVEAFAELVERCDVLVNNAGGALGLGPVARADEEQWRWMYDANVLGTMRVTRALLPRLLAAPAGHVVNVGSVAGVEVYDGGAGYTAAKHGLRAVSQTLRLELLGTPVRITEIAPGMVETDFSLVRLGSREAADRVYAGMTPLTADDVADVIGFAVTRPPHVCLDYVLVKPTDQATATRVHRRAT